MTYELRFDEIRIIDYDAVPLKIWFGLMRDTAPMTFANMEEIHKVPISLKSHVIEWCHNNNIEVLEVYYVKSRIESGTYKAALFNSDYEAMMFKMKWL